VNDVEKIRPLDILEGMTNAAVFSVSIVLANWPGTM